MYSFVVMFSRHWAVQRWFDNLEKMSIPPRTELVVLIDSESANLEGAINYRMDRLHRLGLFIRLKTVITGNPPIPHRKGYIPQEVRLRRLRILENWRLLLDNITQEYILCCEDDTLPPPDAYIRLIKLLQRYDFAQGVEVGRWGSRMLPIWTITDTTIESGRYLEEGLEEMDAGGWFCFAAKRDIFRTVPLVNTDLPMGIDALFWWTATKQGYKGVTDWGIQCEHFGEDFSLFPSRVYDLLQWTKHREGWHMLKMRMT